MENIIKKSAEYIALLFSFLLLFSLQATELAKWTRDIQISFGSVTVYQPKVESLGKKNILKAWAALAYHESDNASPVFGVVWFTAREKRAG